MDITEVWRSGLVRRWHSNPDLAATSQTNGHHSWGCAVLAVHFFPDDQELIKAAILHDVAEVNIGDVSGLAKHLSPKLKDAIDDAECANADLLGVSYKKSQRLKLIDMLDAYLWAKHFNPKILKGSGWPEMVNRISDLSNNLDVDVDFLI